MNKSHTNQTTLNTIRFDHYIALLNTLLSKPNNIAPLSNFLQPNQNRIVGWIHLYLSYQRSNEVWKEDLPFALLCLGFSTDSSPLRERCQQRRRMERWEMFGLVSRTGSHGDAPCDYSPSSSAKFSGNRKTASSSTYRRHGSHCHQFWYHLIQHRGFIVDK